jgi:UDP-N-acetylmuramoyl-L-alanyl-D-glutamate--2,6-diaminopimelate ligase
VRLSALLQLAGLQCDVSNDVDLTGIAYDSRAVRPGNLFVAVPGFHVDGTVFVPDALRRGAVAAIVNASATPAPDPSAIVLAVPDTRAALSALASAWYGHPAAGIRTIGVTGTDGKTTTSYLIQAVLEGAGLRTGLFTTVAYRVAGVWQENESRQTTPEALEVQALLSRMVAGGDQYGVLESTSHGLQLHKLDHCEYDLAVFTNLTGDHLDFHGTVDAYRAAKGRLFELLDSAAGKGIEKLAVLNADDESSDYMASRTSARAVRYGISRPAEVSADSLELGADGSRFNAHAGTETASVELQLPGRFNVSNELAALTVGWSQGIPLRRCAEALSRWPGVPGRMQRVNAGQPFTVIVDYAHTGASFQKALATLRPLVQGRLIAVFGCAGERGVERREGMGQAAAQGADYSVVTTEDPRGEDPAAIIAQIAEAMSSAGAREGSQFERVLDRREAIARAFALAAPGDVVLLAGKGHEHSIITAAGPIPWDEVEIARQLLAATR